MVWFPQSCRGAGLGDFFVDIKKIYSTLEAQGGYILVLLLYTNLYYTHPSPIVYRVGIDVSRIKILKILLVYRVLFCFTGSMRYKKPQYQIAHVIPVAQSSWIISECGVFASRVEASYKAMEMNLEYPSNYSYYEVVRVNPDLVSNAEIEHLFVDII